jgi:subtilase family serine protease
VGGYTPAELAKTYGLTVTGATTQTVAIVDAFNDPTVLADLNTFDANYSIPAETSTSFRVVNQTGGSTLPADDAGWAGEITLDVQAVRGLCRHCKILLVEANDNHNDNLGAAVNYAAAHGKIVSNSYGGPETDPENTAAVKADYNHPGVAILASTGDDGYYAWDVSNAGCPSACSTAPTDGVPSLPASYNTVIGVGGTSLYLNPDGSRAAETVWNENGSADVWGFNLGAAIGAAGSGCSTIQTPQLWQKSVAGYSGLGCGTHRNGVDIAAVADPFTGFDICQTFGNSGNPPCWETIGGTSLASPVIAAMWGLAGGPGGVTNPALSLYGHFKGDRTRPTYDVTVGGTGLCNTATLTSCTGGFNPNNTPSFPNQVVDCAWDTAGASNTPLTNRYQCYARPGYDGVSGVGTPNGITVFKPDAPTAVISSPGTVTHNVTKKFNGSHSTDPFPGGVIKTYAWKWGDGKSSTGSKPSHKYTSKGIRTITLTVTDNYGRKGTKKLKITVH